MKITKLTAYSVHTNQFRNFNFVRVDTDEGIHGVGELFCVGSDKSVLEMVNYVSEWVLGQDPLNRERIQKLYEPIQAKRCIKAIEPYRPFFAEEPIRPENMENWAEIGLGRDVPIATGEQIFTTWDYDRLLKLPGKLHQCAFLHERVQHHLSGERAP